MAVPTDAREHQPGRKQLEDFVDLKRSRLHSQYRKALSESGVSPLDTFPHKLTAFAATRIGWMLKYLEHAFRPKYEFQDYTDCGLDDERGVYAFSDTNAVRIAVAGDWGTGTQEAFQIAKSMGDKRPQFTVHLGDVYYVGDPDEIRENCLGEEVGNVTPVRWPIGTKGSFALNGNHEMYADGFGYFRVLLPTLGVPSSVEGKRFGQKASFFCLRNAHWQIIALDTGYNSAGFPILSQIPFIKNWPGVRPSCRLEEPLLAWLRKSASYPHRATIVLSHHQYFSGFEDEYPKPARQITDLFPSPVLWFWGHEHRFAIYGKHSKRGGLPAYGRCIGHGGMPVSLGQVVRHDVPLVAYDARVYEMIGDRQVGFNGYALLTFTGANLDIEYRDVHDDLLLRERWMSADGQVVGVEIQSPPNLLRTVAPLLTAIR